MESVFSKLISVLASLAVVLTGYVVNTAQVAVPILSSAPTSGLVGHWKFDETTGNTALDSSGNGNDGTLTGGPVWTAGKVGGALQFDGVNDDVTLPGPIISDVGTITGWFNIDSADSDSVIFRDETLNSGTGWILGYNSTNTGPLIFRVAGRNFATTKNFSDYKNVWHHFGLVKDGINVYYYIDGVLVFSGLNAINTPVIFPLHIMRNGQNNSYAKGLVDDIRIYNRALSSQEVLDIYNNVNIVSSQPTPNPVPIPVPISPTPILSLITSPTPTPNTSITNIKPRGNGIVITNISGVNQTNYPIQVSRFFKQGDITNFPKAVIDNVPVLTQADVKSRWPDGSVKHAMISFLSDLSTTGGISVNFINQTSGNNSGELSKDAMLNFNSGNWGAEINTSLGKVNVRDMLSNWNGVDTGQNGLGVRYWLKGPIVTQVIVEDRSSARQYDFGSDTNRSLHPFFILTFYPNTNLGVKVDYVLENMWTMSLQDQTYDLTLKSGNIVQTSVYNKPLFLHIGQTRWRKTFWSGNTPSGWQSLGKPGIKIDYNLPYLIASKVVPNFDLSLVIPQAAINKDVNSFEVGDKGDLGGKGRWTKGMPTTGGREDIGLIPDWYVRYLFTFDPGMYNVLINEAGVSGHVPLHLRESQTGRLFDQTGLTDAFGRVFSVNARPNSWMLDGRDEIGPDKLYKVGPITFGGWQVDVAHHPSMVYIPYLITGDYYLLEEQQFWGSYVAASDNPGINCFYCRHGNWGIVNREVRGNAWGLRSIAHAAFISPDGSSEKIYFEDKMNKNIAVREGLIGLTTGSFYDSSPNSPWTWGRQVLGGNKINNFAMMEPPYDVSPPNSRFSSSVCRAVSPWMEHFNYIVWGHIEELGYSQIRAFKNESMKSLIEEVLDPNYHPYYIFGYYLPQTLKNSAGGCFPGEYIQNVAELKSHISLAHRAEMEASINAQGSIADTVHGYPHIARAAVSYLPGIISGTFTGDAAWNWINNPALGISSRAELNNSPKWAILPRGTVQSTPPLVLPTPTPPTPQPTPTPPTPTLVPTPTPSPTPTPTPTPQPTPTPTPQTGGGGGGSSVSVPTQTNSNSSSVSPNRSAQTSNTTTTSIPKNTISSQNTSSISKIKSRLSSGKSGSDVLTLQTFLIQKGYLTSDSLTGFFGKKTEQAVKNFQKDYGIANSGTPETTGFGAVGPKTMNKINELSGHISQPKSETQSINPNTIQPASQNAIKSNLKRGVSSDEVLLLQKVLVSEGLLDNSKQTGFFGISTETALKQFQTKYNIVSAGTLDTTGFGAVGPKTRIKLNELLSN